MFVPEMLFSAMCQSWQEAIWSAVLDEIQQDAEADIDMANS